MVSNSQNADIFSLTDQVPYTVERTFIHASTEKEGSKNRSNSAPPPSPTNEEKEKKEKDPRQRMGKGVLAEMRMLTQMWHSEQTCWIRVVHSGYGNAEWREALRASPLTVVMGSAHPEGCYVHLPPGHKDAIVQTLMQMNLEVRRKTQFTDMKRANKSRLQFKNEVIIVDSEASSQKKQELIEEGQGSTSASDHDRSSEHGSGSSAYLETFLRHLDPRVEHIHWWQQQKGMGKGKGAVIQQDEVTSVTPPPQDYSPTHFDGQPCRPSAPWECPQTGPWEYSPYPVPPVPFPYAPVAPPMAGMMPPVPYPPGAAYPIPVQYAGGEMQPMYMCVGVMPVPAQ